MKGADCFGALTRFSAAFFDKPKDEKRDIKEAFSGASGLNLGGMVNAVMGKDAIYDRLTNFWLSRLMDKKGGEFLSGASGTLLQFGIHVVSSIHFIHRIRNIAL